MVWLFRKKGYFFLSFLRPSYLCRRRLYQIFIQRAFQSSPQSTLKSEKSEGVTDEPLLILIFKMDCDFFLVAAAADIQSDF